MSNTVMMPSIAPLAKNLPSGEKASERVNLPLNKSLFYAHFLYLNFLSSINYETTAIIFKKSRFNSKLTDTKKSLTPTGDLGRD